MLLSDVEQVAEMLAGLAEDAQEKRTAAFLYGVEQGLKLSRMRETYGNTDDALRAERAKQFLNDAMADSIAEEEGTSEEFKAQR